MARRRWSARRQPSRSARSRRKWWRSPARWGRCHSRCAAWPAPMAARPSPTFATFQIRIGGRPSQWIQTSAASWRLLLLPTRLLRAAISSAASKSFAVAKWSSRLSISRIFLSLAAALVLCVVSGSSRAFDIIPTQGQPVIVTLNEGTLLRLDQSPKSIVIANPDIADVSIRSPRLMYIFGKKTGETTLYATDGQEHVLFNITVRVTHDLARLKQALGEVIPGGQIAADSIDGAVILQGT